MRIRLLALIVLLALGCSSDDPPRPVPPPPPPAPPEISQPRAALAHDCVDLVEELPVGATTQYTINAQARVCFQPPAPQGWHYLTQVYYESMWQPERSHDPATASVVLDVSDDATALRVRLCLLTDVSHCGLPWETPDYVRLFDVDYDDDGIVGGVDAGILRSRVIETGGDFQRWRAEWLDLEKVFGLALTGTGWYVED